MLFCAPVVDQLERIRKRLAATAWCAGMDDPALVVMLDKEGVERDQQLRQGERVPPTLDLDFDRHRSLALLGGPRRFLDVAHRCIAAARCRCPPGHAQTSAIRAIKSQRPTTVSYNGASFVRRASSFPSTRP